MSKRQLHTFGAWILVCDRMAVDRRKGRPAFTRGVYASIGVVLVNEYYSRMSANTYKSFVRKKQRL
jgi:hypothetical protein